jgi:hypothetical protein
MKNESKSRKHAQRLISRLTAREEVVDEFGNYDTAKDYALMVSIAEEYIKRELAELEDSKFVIADLNTMEFFKKHEGGVAIYDSTYDAFSVCGMYELEDVWVMKLVHNYKEPK